MNTWKLDRIGSIGFLVTALFSPCCFPLLGIGLTALGFGSFELFGGWTMYVFQGFMLISITGLFLSYKRHKKGYPFLIGTAGAVIVFYSYYFIDEDYWVYLTYAGMVAVFAASLYNTFVLKLPEKSNRVLESTITCPACGHKSREIMPTDACQYFYTCTNCQTRLKPKEGDCCVFCSYGTVVCPPMQNGQNCCE